MGRAVSLGIFGSLFAFLILALILYSIGIAVSLPETVILLLSGIGAGFFGGTVARAGPIAGALVAATGVSLKLTFFPLIVGIYVLIGGLATGYPNVWHDVREYALGALDMIGSQRITVLAAVGGGAVGGRMPDRVAAPFRRTLTWLWSRFRSSE